MLKKWIRATDYSREVAFSERKRCSGPHAATVLGLASTDSCEMIARLGAAVRVQSTTRTLTAFGDPRIQIVTRREPKPHLRVEPLPREIQQG